MFRKVVVGIDGLRSDVDAIALARAVAPTAETYDLVTVYPDGDAQPSRGYEEYRARLRGDAERLLEAQRAASAIPDAEVHAIPGYAASRALKTYAREQGADLIVLGAAQRGTVDRALVGDVARGVMHGAPCPVLTVAHSRSTGGDRPGRIGVAYDGSPEAELALTTAVDLAQDLGARLDIVQAVDVAVNPVFWGPQLAEYLVSLVPLQDERMRALAESLSVEATGSAVQATPGEALHQLSTRVDLLVCGSRGWGAAGRIAFGSTADRLVHHSPCPVLVVPRGGTAEAASTATADASATAAANG